MSLGLPARDLDLAGFYKVQAMTEAVMKRVRKSLVGSTSATTVMQDGDYLSTGSTLLNLACSGKAFGGFPKGKYVFIVGDSASGKTFISLTCFAEAAKNPNFAKHRLIYDNAEDGAQMDFAKFFGQAVAERAEPPGGSKGDPMHSTTVEEFYYHLDDACKGGLPFVYVLDSMDALSSDDELDKFQEQKKAHRKGKDASGSYGTSKAKMNSSGIRQILPKLRDSGSILVVLSQTRDNLGFGFEKKTRSGGHALRFYASLELWSSIKEKLRRTVMGKQRQVGIMTEIKVKKNRLTGRESSVEVPIYWSFGIDDVGSCVQYLVDEGRWTGGKGTIEAPVLGFSGQFDKLVAKIEAEGLENVLRSEVQLAWQDIEAGCAVQRKARYE